MIIVSDTREQIPWNFNFYGHKMIIETLNAGDYTVKELLNLENKLDKKILRIERKRSTGEIFSNLGRNFAVFKKEMIKLSEYEYKYIICEFNLDILLSFPENSGIPDSKWYRINKEGKIVNNLRMTGKGMLSILNTIEKKYGVETILANDRNEAINIANTIFQKVYNAYKEEI